MRFFSDLSEKNQLIRELFTVHPIKEVCMKFSDYVKVMLMDSVRELIADPGRFARSPGRDFSRNRKIGIRDLLLMLLTMEADCIKEELYRYFGRSTDAPSKAAFYRQRQKLRDDALRSLLLAFNRKCTKKLFKDKYSLVACDGSAADIFRNPSDPDTFYEPNDKSKKGYNQIYINALYSILDKKFVDLVVQPARRHNEYSAFCQMVDRAETENPVIYICDRGYASYNDYAHVIESGQFFLVRCKDVNAQRLLGFSLEGIKAMDYHVDRILSRSVSRKKRLHPELSDQYRHICRNVPMDYISAECPEYHMSLRVVRFQLPGGTFENLITNLPDLEFSLDDFRDLYHMRWDEETAYRDLKYPLCLKAFHSKKYEYTVQEVWARAVLHNFCMEITIHVEIPRKNTKHVYQANYSEAIKICRDFLGIHDGITVLDVEGLIAQNTEPVRPGRTYARQARFKLPMSFCYRH